MGDIFFNGVWRMDWGLGNPNTTAALIATLMIAVWILAFVRRWGFWVALVLFTLLGGCLIHTISRGGLVAMFVGVIPLVIAAPRPWPIRKIIAVGVAVWAMIGFAFYLNAHKRYSQGVATQDRSISNRLHVWSHAPAMIVDAPHGWGFRNAAKSYMRWYQPLTDTESYRTFVNSHLEWLVEFSWPARFFYLFGWGAIFLLCIPAKRSRWYAIPFGVWLAFGVAATFSSVAASPWLWILPGVLFLSVLVHRLLKKQWPQSLGWGGPIGAAALLCIALWMMGGGERNIQGSRDQVVIGKGKVLRWLVVDEQVLGGDRFSRALRRHIEQYPDSPAIGIVWSLTALPDDLAQATVIISGASGKGEQIAMQRIASDAAKLVFFSPSQYPQEFGIGPDTKPPMNAFFGEFSQSTVLSAWEETGKVHRVEGAGDYFPAWPQIAFEVSR